MGPRTKLERQRFQAQIRLHKAEQEIAEMTALIASLDKQIECMPDDPPPNYDRAGAQKLADEMNEMFTHCQEVPPGMGMDRACLARSVRVSEIALHPQCLCFVCLVACVSHPRGDACTRRVPSFTPPVADVRLAHRSFGRTCASLLRQARYLLGDWSQMRVTKASLFRSAFVRQLGPLR
jgi:hypothetical protein